ncbi:MAG TPA: FeoA family protein [Anaerolineales bacterium]|nr:ferrous iron transport protein A [Anaerolineales bacterium]HUS85526.1 FeoA family protein [Anaerolineales bacterium]
MSPEIESKYKTRLLSDVPSGGRVRMVGFARRGRRSRRLAEMGINPGTEITVIQADPGQPLLLRVRGSQLAIDRRVAHHLFVTPLEPLPESFRGRRGWRRWGRGGGPRGRGRRSGHSRRRGKTSPQGLEPTPSERDEDEG